MTKVLKYSKVRYGLRDKPEKFTDKKIRILFIIVLGALAIGVARALGTL
jgi:hypothetical protein